MAFNRFKKTAAYDALKQSNNEVSLMAIPLTYAMSMNVIFMVAVIFIPGLWSVIEYIFPFALLGFIDCGLRAQIVPCLYRAHYAERRL